MSRKENEFSIEFDGKIGLNAGKKPPRPRVLGPMILLPNGMYLRFGSEEVAQMMIVHLRRAFTGEMDPDELEDVVLEEYRESWKKANDKPYYGICEECGEDKRSAKYNSYCSSCTIKLQRKNGYIE